MEISHIYKEQHKRYFLSAPVLPQNFKFRKVDSLIEFQFSSFGLTVSSNSHHGLTLNFVIKQTMFQKKVEDFKDKLPKIYKD